MYNILSIDVEDTFQFLYADSRGKQAQPTKSVVESTRDILSILNEYDAKATFFVLGIVAEKFPHLVSEIAEGGHEVATHGYSHRFVSTMSPPDFAHDLNLSKRLIEDACGMQVTGHRAPAFSFGANRSWVFDLMLEHGIQYDSSIVPGKADGAASPINECYPFYIVNDLIEVPITTINFLGKRLLMGGTYFRFIPYKMTHNAITSANNDGRPAVIYLHPYEFASYKFPTSTNSYDYSAVSLKKRLLTYGHRQLRKINRTQTEIKIRLLLENFKFATIQETLKSLE